MNNSSFVNTDDFTKVNNLVDVLYKRCRGFIKREVLISVVNRLDLTRQMSIEIVNENEFKEKVKEVTILKFCDNELNEVETKWVRFLIGSANVGKEVIHSTKEETIYTVKEDTKIITHPAIAIVENQILGSADTTDRRLIIYF